jgi:hypothetical protein
MKQVKRTVSIIVGTTILSFSMNDAKAAESNPNEALKACARTENTDERVACYEVLGKRVLDDELDVVGIPEVAASSMPEAQAVSVEAPAETGVVNSEDDEYKPIRGHVRSCQEASDKRWFFVLDSGEVWKQSGGRARRFKDCDFDVTIRRDIFGYKMEIDGDDKTVRVRRQK